MADPAWAKDWDAEAPASAPAHDGDAPAWAKDWSAPAPKGAQPSPHHPTPSRPRTQFQRTATATSDPELSMGEALAGAAHNLGPSARDAGVAVVGAVMHPIKTAETIGDLGKGLISQGAGAIGIQQDPTRKASAERLAKAVEAHYGETYGSARGFKKALATDPVSIAMDAATLMDGAGLGAKAAGLTKTAALSKTASVVDPIQNAVRVAKVAAKPVGAAARAASSVATGVPSDLLKAAAAAGRDADPAHRAAFKRFYSGQGDPSDFLTKTQDAIKATRADASADYLAKKAALSGAQPSYRPIEDAIAEARRHTLRNGVNVGQFPDANKAIDRAENLVNAWKAAPPQGAPLEDFDNLKQAIWDIRDDFGNDVAKRHIGGIYNGVKRAITDIDPEYAKLMESYQLARTNINDLQRTMVGAGANPAATLAMSKTMRALKTPNGKNLFSQLAEKEPTLPYMLAGQALSPWRASGRAGFLEGLTAGPLAITAGVAAHNPLAGVGTLAGQFVGQSPKIAGGVSYASGAAGRGAAKIHPVIRGAYYGERAGEADGEPEPEARSAPDFVWQKMKHIESGNRQVDAKGNLIVSPAGAVGIAQLMPATARAVAIQMGKPELAEVALQPTEEGAKANEEIGQFHYQDNLKRYEGDPLRAAAAYNSNPRAVDRAIELAESKGGDWTDYLPRETQQYVRDLFSGRAGFASGGGVTSDIEPLVGRLMTAADAARKHTFAATKPLLKSDDDAVAHALAVAGRAI